MKKCPNCGLEKENLLFTRNSTFADGLSRLCRECRSIERKEQKARRTPEKRALDRTKAEAEKLLLSQNKKFCRCCKVIKSISEFYTKVKNRDGLQSSCKSCSRDTHKKHRREHPGREFRQRRKRVYGIAPEDFDQIVMNQGGRCAICQQPFIKTPHLDHDHATGKIRGVLCADCNLGIGLLKEAPERLRAAASYLERK